MMVVGGQTLMNDLRVFNISTEALKYFCVPQESIIHDGKFDFKNQIFN